MSKQLKHKKGAVILAAAALMGTAIATTSCSNSLDIRYQNISEAGKKTIAYVKTKPYKSNTSEAGFPKYLDDARSREPDYLVNESFVKEEESIEKGGYKDVVLPVWNKFKSQKFNPFLPEPIPEPPVPEDAPKYYYNNVHYFEPDDNNYSRVIFYLHGGAYFKNISEKHVMTCKTYSEKFDAKVYMPLYPIAPAKDANDCFYYIDQIYQWVVNNESDKEIIIMGDSAGGGLAISYTQYLFKNKKDVVLPSARILFSPWCDVSMNNQQIPSLEDKDVFLSQYGLKEIGKIWSGAYDTTDYKVSPKYGSFDDKIPTIIFHGSDEILFPDAKATAEKMAKAGTRVRFVIGKGLFHIYPAFIYTLPEAKEALDMAYDFVVNKK